MATIGTTAEKVVNAGEQVVLQNLGPGKVAFSYNATPAVAAGGRGLVLAVDSSSDPFVASADVYAVADQASTDLRVERL